MYFIARVTQLSGEKQVLSRLGTNGPVWDAPHKGTRDESTHLCIRFSKSKNDAIAGARGLKEGQNKGTVYVLPTTELDEFFADGWAFDPKGDGIQIHMRLSAKKTEALVANK